MELYSVFLPQQRFHPGFQRPVGAEQADVLFKIGIQLCRRFSVYLFHDGGGVRPGVHFHIPLSAVDREQPVGEGARDRVGEGTVVRAEELPVQQLVHRQIAPGLEIIACPVQIFYAPPSAVKVHGKPFADGRTVRTVQHIADDVGIFMEADALDRLIINGVNAVRRAGKAVTGIVVAIYAPNLLRRIAEEVFDPEIRRQSQHGADVGKAALLQRGDLPNIAAVFAP